MTDKSTRYVYNLFKTYDCHMTDMPIIETVFVHKFKERMSKMILVILSFE